MKKYMLLSIILFIFLLTACGLPDLNKSESDYPIEQTPIVTPEPTPEIIRIEVPNITNMSLAEAQQILAEAGFTNLISDKDYDTEWSKDRIIVVSQDPAPGNEIEPDELITMSCKRECQLYIDVKSEGNLLFSKYDMEFRIDDEEVGIISNGESFTYLTTVLEGTHSVSANKSGDDNIAANKELYVKNDTTFKSDILHSSSSIEFRNMDILDDVKGASLPVPDVKGLMLSKAFDELKGVGFINVREEPYGDIWNRNNWIVLGQNIEPNMEIDKNDQIVLSCKALDDYFNEMFSHKTLVEAQEIAKEQGITLYYYQGGTYTGIGDQIGNVKEEDKELWIVRNSDHFSGSEMIACLYMDYTGIVTPAPTVVPTDTPKPTAIQTATPKPTNTSTVTSEPPATPKPTTAPTATPKVTPTSKPNLKHSVDYHSSGDREEAKKGNSGVFAYKKSGNYDIYLIIDFDSGYVYRFLDGNGDKSCDKVKIDSGTLNDIVIFTYHDGDTSWENGVCFKWVRMPDILLYQDGYGEYEFLTTDLNTALSIMYGKKMYEY